MDEVDILIKKLFERYGVEEGGTKYPRGTWGHILLEEVRDPRGNVIGYISIDPSELKNILEMIIDPTKRPKELRNLDIEKLVEVIGYKKYFDRWYNEIPEFREFWNKVKNISQAKNNVVVIQ